MLQHLKEEANVARTENGALSHATTGKECLDLFAAMGGLRNASDADITQRFLRAYAEDPDIAMKLLFFARDVRGGLGERRVFRTIVKWLAEHEPGSLKKNLPSIAEFGRWDDLLTLMGTGCEADALNLMKVQLVTDLQAMERGAPVSLLAKWLPSINASSAETVRLARRIARCFGMNDAEYRRTLVKLRACIRIIENNLRQRDYSFDYEKQPSRAMYKYRRAFVRNDAQRYTDFLHRVSRGEAKLNTAALTPCDIVAPCFGRTALTEEERRAMDVTWNAQPDFTGDENALVVVDGSASMYRMEEPSPAAVAMSLAVYFAERNRGTFRDHFITFSSRPRLVKITGRDIAEKIRFCMSFNEVANTNLQRVFELILKTAVKHRIPRSEMPSTVYIISDMEFDCCTRDADLTNFQYARELFASKGYQLPRVVFWNVASRSRQQPVKENEQGVALVSGSSPRIFDMLSGGDLSPMGYMLRILNAERYRNICA